MAPVGDLIPGASAPEVPSLEVAIEPSAVTELMWVLYDLQQGRVHRDHPIHANKGLAARVRQFWPVLPGDCAFDELVILAATAGGPAGTDIRELLERLPALCRQQLGDLPLRTETPAHRRLILQRLASLRNDDGLRDAYQRLLRDVWEEIAPTWRSEGLSAVQAGCRALRDQANRGARLSELLPPRHWALFPPFRSVVLEAIAGGRLLLTPGYFSGTVLVLELPGYVLVGLPVQLLPRAEELRRRVRKTAEALKALSDPTRLAMLAYLADTPASVTELASEFSLAQPTVSVHLRQLKEARLVEPTRDGPLTRYVVVGDALTHLLEDTRTRILGLS